ncbi:MAG: cyclic nucleotide-binding domain-containing protein [Planctomycetota bacterium]
MAAARAALDEVAQLLAPFGLALDPALEVRAEANPCPGYVHAERAISFCPPVVEVSRDRLRWLFFARVMGCKNLDEAREFYAVGLPLLIAHEATHHLRLTRGRAVESPFVEEQVCNAMAVALLEASPRWRTTLPALRAVCARMRARLAADFVDCPGAAFLPSVGEQLVAEGRVAREELARVAAMAREQQLALDEVVRLLPGLERSEVLGAEEARARAREEVDVHYTEDPARYWFMGLCWLDAYLEREPRPGLLELVREHLLEAGEGLARREVEAALETMLRDPGAACVAAGGALEDAGEAVRGAIARVGEGGGLRAALAGAAAAGLLELLGPAALPRVVARTDDAPEGERAALLEALARVWPLERTWPTADVAPLCERLLRETAPRTARLALRLAGKCGLAIPAAARDALRERLVAWGREHGNDGADPPGREAGAQEDEERALLELELLTADPRADEAALLATLDAPGRTRALLEAWEAWSRGLDELPRGYAAALLARERLSPRLRHQLLRVAGTWPGPLGGGWVRLAVAEQLDPTLPRSARRSAAELTERVLRRARPEDVAAEAVAALPGRGGDDWRVALGLLAEREAEGRAALERAAADGSLRACAARSDLAGAERPELAPPLADALERGFALLALASALRWDEDSTAERSASPNSRAAAGALMFSAEIAESAEIARCERGRASESESETEAEAEAESEAETEAESEAEAESESEAETEAEAESESEAETEAESESGIVPVPVPVPESEPRSGESVEPSASLRLCASALRRTATAAPDPSAKPELALESAIGEGDLREALARSLEEAALQLGLELARCLTPLARADAVEVLATPAARDDAALRALLVSGIHEPLRGRLSALLAGERSPTTRRLTPDELPRFARAALRACGARWPALRASVAPRLMNFEALEPEDVMALSIVERIVQLRAVPLFADLDPEGLHDIARLCVAQTLPSDHVLFRAGEPAGTLYLVLSGGLRVCQGEQEVAVLGPGACCGEMGLFERRPHSATVTTRSETRLLVLAGSAVTALGRDHPQLYEAFLAVLSARLRAANQR